MRLGRFLLMVLGAALGTLVVVWAIRYRRITVMPGSVVHEHYQPSRHWIELK